MNTDLRKLLRVLAVFTAPLVVLFLLLEIRLSRVPNSYSKKRDALERGRDTIEVITTGSSHGLYGIDPSALSRPAVNLANVSQSLVADAQITEMALSRLPHLQTIVMPVSYFSLEYEVASADESWRNNFYVRFYGIATDGPFWTHIDPASYSLFLMYGADQTRTILASRFHVDLAPTMTDLGWERAEGAGTMAIDEERGKARVALHEKIMHPGDLGEIVGAVEHLLGAARERKVRVAFITTPVFSTYARAMDRGRWGRHQEKVRELCRKYGVTYSDFLEDRRFERGDFHDNDHLNAEGAGKFTRIVEAEVLGRE